MSKMPIKMPLPNVNFLGDLVSEVIGYLNSKETEKTKRIAIRAATDVKIEQIKATKEVFLSFIENEYKERANNYKELFERLDRGIESGDTKLMELAMMGIIEQVKKNPFETFSEFSKNLQNTNYIEEF